MLRRRKMFPRFCVFPGYRWCGPGCNGPGYPINDLDATCMGHDECYRYFGSSYECDIYFLQQLRYKMNPYTTEGRQAKLLYNYMKLQLLFRYNFKI